MKSDRPFVLVNMAISADGKIASAGSGVNHFSSPRDETHLYELRATVDAVLNGARTVDTTPVKMDAGPAKFIRQRRQRGLEPHPLRIIASGSGTLSPAAEVFRHHTAPIILLTTQRCPPGRIATFEKLNAQVIISPSSEIQFIPVMARLYRSFRIKRLLCEGGGQLNDALFRADLVDEVHLTVCPVLIGGRMSPTLCDGTGFDRLKDARQFELVRRRSIGDELFLTYRRKP